MDITDRVWIKQIMDTLE